MASHPSTAPSTQRSPWALAVRIGAVVLVATLLWVLLTRIADWDDVVAALGDLSPGDWTRLLGAALLRVAVEPLLLMAVTPGLTYLRGIPAFLAPAATATLVPGPSDLAARYAMYRSWGIPASQTSSSVILWLVYSTAAKMMLPVVAFGLLLFLDRDDRQDAVIAIVAGGMLVALTVFFAVMLRSEGTARRLGTAAGTAAHRIARVFRIAAPDTLARDLGDRLARFRNRTGYIVRSRSHVAIVAALAQQGALFLILLGSVRSVGITPEQLDWVAVFGAFAVVQLITTVPITPGGLGVAEAAYVTLLAVGSTGGLVGAVAAAAILNRIFSWLILVPLGGVSWLVWSRTVARAPAPAGDGPPRPN